MRKSELLLFALSLCLGAAAPAAEPGTPEVGGHIGGQWLEAAGTKFAVGGNSYVALNQRIWVGGEITYAPLANVDLKISKFNISINARLWDFAGNMQVNLTTGGKVVPYLVGGPGAGRCSLSGFGEDFRKTRFAINAGTGFRYYAGKNWGIRPEFKVIKYKDGVSSARFTVALFYQFGK